MKIVVQRVSRATLEVNGSIDSRIGQGLLVFVGVGKGDSLQKAQALAQKLLKIKLWPEVLNLDTQFATSVTDNGYEIMVINQQTLCSGFDKSEVPDESMALAVGEASSVFDGFVQSLRQGYQEEMVISKVASLNVQVEAVTDTVVFELEADGGSGKWKSSQGTYHHKGERPMGQAKVEHGEGRDLPADVMKVTEALTRLPRLKGASATLESCRIFRILSDKRFRMNLTEADPSETDSFAEALDAAAGHFSQKQQQQITTWTGLSVVAPVNDEEVEQQEDDMEKQLAELTEHANKPMYKTPRSRGGAKAEYTEEADGQEWREDGEDQPKVRPDWRGRAAPVTPAGKGNPNRPQVPRYQPSVAPWVKGKGGGRGPRPPAYGYAVPENEVGVLRAGTGVKRPGAALAAAAKLPKGTPTLAPDTPAPQDDVDEL